MSKKVIISVILLLLAYIYWFVFILQADLGMYPYKDFSVYEESVILNEFYMQQNHLIKIVRLDAPKEGTSCLTLAFRGGIEDVKNCLSAQKLDIDSISEYLEQVSGENEIYISSNDYSAQAEEIIFKITKQADNSYIISASKNTLGTEAMGILSLKRSGPNVFKLVFG